MVSSASKSSKIFANRYNHKVIQCAGVRQSPNVSKIIDELVHLGPEHADMASHSFCTQNIFHAPLALGTVPDNALGYVSHDGHSYDCKDPALLHQSFHVYVFRMISKETQLLILLPRLSIFVIDR